MKNINTDKSMTSPGVKIPPPVIYFVFFFIGIMLGRIFPLPSFALFLVHIIGWLFAIASLMAALLAMKEFRAAQTTIRPDRPASNLILTGIFRLTRNPLYLSLLLIYCGAGIFLGTWWPIILVPLLVATINFFVIRREERFLTERFGLAYNDYCKKVRRWI
jgi:protein-S-isoprenylcysteine O-methyltransferase Ste14